MQNLFRAVVVAAVTSGAWAQAGTATFSFNGGGVVGGGILTFETNTVVGDPAGALAVVGAVGTFSDSNIGLSNLTITGVRPINPVTVKGLPASFSSIAVTNPPTAGEGVSYDNLLYFDGSPIVCPDYPGAGGYLDVYGVMLTLSNGFLVDFYSNGAIGGRFLGYGVVVVDTTSKIVDAQKGLEATIPEPASAVLLGVGALGLAAWRRQAGRAAWA